MKTFWSVFFAILAAVAVIGAGIGGVVWYNAKQEEKAEAFKTRVKLVTTTVQLLHVIQNDRERFETEMALAKKYIGWLDPYLKDARFAEHARRVKIEAESHIEVLESR